MSVLKTALYCLLRLSLSLLRPGRKTLQAVSDIFQIAFNAVCPPPGVLQIFHIAICPSALPASANVVLHPANQCSNLVQIVDCPRHVSRCRAQDARIQINNAHVSFLL